MRDLGLVYILYTYYTDRELLNTAEEVGMYLSLTLFNTIRVLLKHRNKDLSRQFSMLKYKA